MIKPHRPPTPELCPSVCAAYALLFAMSSYWQSEYEFEWDSNEELALFRAVTASDGGGPETARIRERLDRIERTTFRWLYSQAGGWWKVMPGDREPSLIPREAWEEYVSQAAAS